MKPLLGVLRRDQALADLESQAEYIAQSQLDVAVRLIQQFDATIENLRRFPHLGRAYRTRTRGLAGIRMIPVEGFRTFLLFYRVHPAHIEILRLLHASRNCLKILQDE